jgi:hypothetical protein
MQLVFFFFLGVKNKLYTIARERKRGRERGSGSGRELMVNECLMRNKLLFVVL